jgi:hypothetical protein
VCHVPPSSRWSGGLPRCQHPPYSFLQLALVHPCGSLGLQSSSMRNTILATAYSSRINMCSSNQSTLLHGCLVCTCCRARGLGHETTGILPAVIERQQHHPGQWGNGAIVSHHPSSSCSDLLHCLCPVYVTQGDICEHTARDRATARPSAAPVLRGNDRTLGYMVSALMNPG